MASKKSITKNEYLQLVGLLTLASRQIRILDEIQKTVQEIVGEDDEHGHTSDAIYCDYSVDDLLERLGIEVTFKPVL